MKHLKHNLLLVLLGLFSNAILYAQEYQYYVPVDFTWEGDFHGNRAVWKGGDTHNAYQAGGVHVQVDLLDTFGLNTTPFNLSEFNDFTKTNTFFGRGNLVFQIKSFKSGQNVCLNFTFDKPITLENFTIFDIDMLQSGKRPISTFLDSLHLTAYNSIGEVPLTVSQMSELSQLIINGQQVKALYRPGIKGDLKHDDPAGAVRIYSEDPIENFKICLANGSEDDGLSNSQAIKINKFTFRELVGSISGMVKDRKNDIVLPGFRVYLVDSETDLPVYNKDGHLMTAITDNDGKYRFDLLPMGKYKVIQVDNEGFESDNDIDGMDDNIIFAELSLINPFSIDNDFYETPFTPLPVRLTDMDVKHLRDAVYQVHWKVQAEINNEKYIVEISENGKTFDVIGIHQAYNRHNVSYSFDFEYKGFRPAFFVRLSQADFDGKQTELGIRKVESNKTRNEVIIYPNPASEYLVVRWGHPGYTQYEVLNPDGRSVLSGQIPVDALSWQIQLSDLPESMYYITLSGQQRQQTIPVMKQ